MATIRSLLNPASDKHHEPSMPVTPRPSPTASEVTSPRKKVKLTKDAPVFTPGSIRGECRFPPDEFQDDVLAAHHQQFEVSPFGEIADYPRHIPYNSEKKSFLEKTHREHLNVFQYTFKVPGDDHHYAMLWDYNIGLVRTTPLFKCTGHSKTTPAKMIVRNPGLKDICHSITGGALVAQGYWIPHAAAKAIAATFCYDVRFALTPVFGHDFPSMCIKPGQEGFGVMVIDPAITKHCADEAKRFREAEKRTISRQPTTSIIQSTPSTPVSRRHKINQSRVQRKREQTYTSPYSSPYTSDVASDVASDDDYTTIASSPTPTNRNFFTPVNTPRVVPRSIPYPDRYLPSPTEILSQSPLHQYRIMPSTPMTPPPSAKRRSSSPVSPKTIPVTIANDELKRFKECTQSIAKVTNQDMDWLSKHIPAEDESAAYVLLSLKLNQSPEEAARALGLTLPSHDEEISRSASA